MSDELLNKILQEITVVRTDVSTVKSELTKVEVGLVNLRSTVDEKMVTKAEFQESKNEIITHIDGFI